MPKRLLLASVLLVAAVVVVALWSDRSVARSNSRAAPARQAEAPARDTEPPPIPRAGRYLLGHVVEDQTNRPVAGAAIIAYAFETARTLRTTSAADGTFDVPDAAAEGRAFQLVVGRDGFGTVSLLHLAPGQPTVVRLPRPGGIRGRVVAAPDAPVPDCRVSAVRAGSPDVRELLFRQLLPAELGIDATAVTNADGTFEITGLAPGRYALVAERAGFAHCDTDEVKVRAGAMTPADIEILRTAEIRVEVFDEETGQPVDGARFEMARWPVYVPLEAEERGAGAHTLHAGFDGRCFPWVDLRVSREGYARRLLSLAAQEGQCFQLEKGQGFRVALGRGATIDGHVWSGDRPAEGAAILVRPLVWAIADARGAFEIGGIDAGDGQVSVRVHAGAAEPIAVMPLVLRNGERRTIDVGGPGTTEIEGRIAIGGVPLADEVVDVSGASKASATSDRDGRFRFEGLNAGRHELFVNLAGARFSRHADVARGQRLRLDIDARCTISGTVVDARSGEPITRRTLLARGPWPSAPIGGARMGVLARSGSDDIAEFGADDDGRFRLSVEPGVYRLGCVFHEARAADPPLVDVSDGTDAECVLRVSWGTLDGRVEVDVRDARTGGSATGCRYGLGRTSGPVQDGRISLKALDAGVHRIRIWSDTHVSAAIDVELSDERPTAKETVVLEPSEAVRVRRIGRESPAAQAGLRSGDTILSCNGIATPTIAALRAAMAEAQGPIRLEVDRSGERRFVTMPAKEPTLELENVLLGR